MKVKIELSEVVRLRNQLQQREAEVYEFKKKLKELSEPELKQKAVELSYRLFVNRHYHKGRSVMKEMKFRVKNEEHSEAIQKRLFELGYKCTKGKELSQTDASYLYTNSIGTILFSDGDEYFNSNSSIETTLEDLYDNIYSKKFSPTETEDYNGLKEQFKRFETSFSCEECKKWFSIGYKLGYDKSIEEIFKPSKNKKS